MSRSRLSDRCVVCKHPERARIEMLRAGGVGFEALAAKFGVHRDQVWRHWHKHVSDETKAQYLAGPVQLHELAERAAAEGLSLLDYLHVIRASLMALFSSSVEAKDAYRSSLVAGRLLECLREIGKLTGELVHAGAVTITQNTLVLNSPAFASLQATIIEALAPFPEARRAVVEALRTRETNLDATAAPLMLEAKPRETCHAGL
jgi:hypothetical protein